MMSWAKTLVPLTDQACRVTSSAKLVRDRQLIERQSELRFLTDVRIEFMAETSLVPPCEKSRARRAAIGRRNIAASAADSSSGQGVDVGRRHVFAAVDADVG